MDFGQFQKLEPVATAEFLLPENLCVLIVAAATEVNRPYFKEQLRLYSANRTRNAHIQNGFMNEKYLDEFRNEERVSFSKFVVKGWRDVVFSDGSEAPFNQENCLKLLQALPDHLFDELRAFCGKVGNFVEKGIDAEDMAKNSPSD